MKRTRFLTRTPEERLWEKVTRKGKKILKTRCWEWIGAKNTYGYGNFWISDKTEYAHRMSFRWYVGPIPKNLKVCHRCDNPPCIRPSHLWLGTDADNSRDMSLKNRGTKGARRGFVPPERYPEVFSMRELGLTVPQLSKHFDISNYKMQRILWTKYKRRAHTRCRPLVSEE